MTHKIHLKEVGNEFQYRVFDFSIFAECKMTQFKSKNQTYCSVLSDSSSMDLYTVSVLIRIIITAAPHNNILAMSAYGSIQIASDTK